MGEEVNEEVVPKKQEPVIQEIDKCKKFKNLTEVDREALKKTGRYK